MYDPKHVYEILLKNKGGETQVGILVDEDLGDGPFRARLYDGDLLLAGETRKIKLMDLEDEIQELIKNGSEINLVDLEGDNVIPVSFVPSLNGA